MYKRDIEFDVFKVPVPDMKVQGQPACLEV
jgi:hypothetical protein